MAREFEGKFVVFNGNNGNLVRRVLKSMGWTDSNEESPSTAFECGDFNLCWKPTASYRTKRKNASTIFHVTRMRQDESIRLLNHFDNNHVLCTKTGLNRSLSAYYKKQGVQLNEVMPNTYIVSSVGTKEWEAFQNDYYGTSNMNKKWICKPSSLNCGRGIEVFDDVVKIRQFVKKSKSGPVVLQQYIDKPLLYNNRKFDIRIWALVLCDGSIHISKEGYLRTCSSEYSDSSLSDPTAHLTNYSMQKKSSKLGAFEPGNALSFQKFQQYLDDKKINASVHEDILPRISAIVSDTIRATWKHLNSRNYGDNIPFELFGYDFMLDENLKPWLLEVNTNPGLAPQNHCHGELLERLLKDMFKIISAHTFDSSNHYKMNNNHMELECRNQGEDEDMNEQEEKSTREFSNLIFEQIYHPGKAMKSSRIPKGGGRAFEKWLTVLR